jgi:hypothetical protein
MASRDHGAGERAALRRGPLPLSLHPESGASREAAMPHLPRVGLLLGDPSGVGPELVAKLLGGADRHR